MDFESPAIRNGVIGGLTAVVVSLLFYVVDTRTFLSFSGFLVWIIYIVFVVKATREQKRLVDHFDFKEALKTGFLAYVIASLFYVVFYYVLSNFVDPGLVEIQREIAVSAIEKMSSIMGEEGTEAALEGIESQDMTFTLKSALLTFAGGLIFPGIIFALIVASIYKDPKPAV